MKLFLITLVIFCSFFVYEANAKIYDLSLVDLEILETEVFLIEENPNYPFDAADIVKIKFQVTKTEPGLFIASDRMFRLVATTPSFLAHPVLDSFRGQSISFKAMYDDNFEVRYKGLESYHYFEDCEYFHDVLLYTETKSYTVCYDVLRRLNIVPVDFEGNKQYILTLMDNIQSNSCPNCRELLLSSGIIETIVPQAIIVQEQNNHGCRKGLELIFKISDGSFGCVKPQTAKKLIERGWGIKTLPSIRTIIPTFEDGFIQSPTQATGEHTRLTLSTPRSHLYNGGDPIVFAGTLWGSSSGRIPNAEIIIKNDGPCPEDHIIAKGITDQKGKYKIYESAKVWDASDNQIIVHAEFAGNEKFFPSISKTRNVIVYPSHGEKCEN